MMMIRMLTNQPLTVFWLFLSLPGLVSAIEVEDDWGRQLKLRSPAQRVIALSPHATELLFAAGADKRLIAAVDYSDFPVVAKDLPRVGGNQALDVERILGLKPDLIVAWGSGNGEAVIERLRALGLNVFVSEPRRLPDIASNIDRLGRLMATTSVSHRASQAYLDKLHGLRSNYSNQAKVSVFYQLWNQPLMTVNGEHMISSVIRLCGGHNIFNQQQQLAPVIDKEAVIKANPQVILAGGEIATRQSWLDAWSSWSNLDAVQKDNLFLIDVDLLQRATSRVLLGAEKVCEALDHVRAKLAVE